ncbi:Pycsar system effector family protein [Pannonibacter indicus]|uniref:Pycsar system effector family protein n=1 Tax=Pannonibacter indicus TaxID=466044 RepID=UPI0035ADC84C
MAKNDQQEAYEKLLSANHNRMIEFSRFAEAKNAALLTFCSVWMGAIITLLRSSEELPIGFNHALKGALLFLFVAAVISLQSLLPKFLDHMHKREDDYKCLLYFGDIAKIGTKDYPDMAADLYLPTGNDSTTATYLHDLSVQTAIHAKIADRKFRMFNLAGTLVLTAFAIMTLPPLVFGTRWVISQLHC